MHLTIKGKEKCKIVLILYLDLQSDCDRISSMVISGSLLINIPCFFNCSFRSLKSASSTLGLFGGDLGDPPQGVFLQVDCSDIIAEEMGDTLADDLAEYSLCASFNIFMYSLSSIGTGVILLGELGTGGEEWEGLKSL